MKQLGVELLNYKTLINNSKSAMMLAHHQPRSPKMSESESKLPKPKRSFSLRALLLLVTLAALGMFGKLRWDDYQKQKILSEWVNQILSLIHI